MGEIQSTADGSPGVDADANHHSRERQFASVVVDSLFPLFTTGSPLICQQKMPETDKKRTSYLQASCPAILTLTVKVSVYHCWAVTSTCPKAYTIHPAVTQEDCLNHRITRLSGGSRVACVCGKINLNKDLQLI